MAKLKLPTAKPKLASVAQAATAVDPPQVIEVKPAQVTPSLLIMGDSGTGKSFALARILQALPKGVRGLLLSVENKAQQLLKYKPLIVPIGAPTDGRTMSAITKLAELEAFAEALAVGSYREHNGERIGVILLDGLIEVGDIVYAAKRKTISKSNNYQMWDEVAEGVINFCAKLRDAAGTPEDITGFPPIPVVATVGEQTVEVGGELRYLPLLPGQKALKRLHYPFDAAWRLDTGIDENNECEYRIHTVGTEQFKAKSPAGLFAPTVRGTGVGVDPDNEPDAGAMFKALTEWYQ